MGADSTPAIPNEAANEATAFVTVHVAGMAVIILACAG